MRFFVSPFVRHNIVVATVGVCAFVFGGISPSRADVIFSGSGGNANSGQNFTYGFNFTPVVDITVDSLGFIDAGQDGLVASHRVGIWDSVGSLLTSATVTTGNSTLGGPVMNGSSQYRFTSVVPINLTQGVTYTFGAAIEGAADTWFSSGTNISASPALASVTSSGFFVNGNFVRPTGNIGNTYNVGSFTATATAASSAPEPGTLCLIALGMVGGIVKRRRK